MVANRNKTDQIHDQMPALTRSKQNKNWKALISALGEQDQLLATLIEEVRKQFFVRTASRPYLDRLGVNVSVDRPRFIGMDDVTLRKYIPILSYQPKQVKLIIDQLLDIFFFKESTTAFTETTNFEPFVLKDGWTLDYKVDGEQTEKIKFEADDFSNISAATAKEIVSAINKQATHSFAIVFENSITDKKTIKIFTNTVGSKGSIEILGGLANTDLKFEGFITDAGNGNNTQWTVTKAGDTMTFKHTAGNSPGLEFVRKDDVVMIDLPGNQGSFIVDEVVVAENKIVFNNLFGTAGTFTQTSDKQVKFMRPDKAVVYTERNRAITWETQPGQITVEMPASPPVVRRSLRGSAHINGITSVMSNRDSDTSLTLEDASDFPTSGGYFVIQQQNEIQTKIKTVSEDTTTTKNTESRLIGSHERYKYTGKSGNTLTGITPNLPPTASNNTFNIATIVRDTSNIMTVTTSAAHNFKVGEWVVIEDSTPTAAGPPNLVMDVTSNGTWEITEVVNTTTFKVFSFGDQGTATGGTARVERFALSNNGSVIMLTSSQPESTTKLKGPYVWDLNAAFVLASKLGTISEEIKAGQVFKTLTIGTNNLPNSDGQLIFDFGTDLQEGPVRYLYKPSDNTLALDPAYVFQNNHAVGSSVTLINQRGAHAMSGKGTEYPPYVTDPAVAREIFQELVLKVKSVGIFVEFLVRYPVQLYSTVDVYRSGNDPG